MIGYSDAGFANSRELKSQLWSIILLIDGSDISITIAFRNYKTRLVAPSVLSTEVIGFSEVFDHAYALMSQLKQSMQCTVPMHLLTGSNSLLDVISKVARTSDK